MGTQTTLDQLDQVVQRYNARSGKKPVDTDGLLVSLLRACFTGSPGNGLVIADLAQIEARVVCWIAGQDDALAEFADYDALVGDAKKARDPYRLTAARLYTKDPLAVTKDERHLGKTIELACGFGQGARGFGMFCAVSGIDLAAAGVTPKQCVDVFRERKPKIPLAWKAFEAAAISVITGDSAEAYAARCRLRMRGPHLKVELPSGRVISYPFARVEDMVPGFCARMNIPAFTKPTMTYHDAKRGRISTYGGKLIENVTQAIASDCLRESKLQWEEAGLPVVIDIHDEAVADVPTPEAGSLLPVALGHMEALPAWGAGLPVKAEGVVCVRYQK